MASTMVVRPKDTWGVRPAAVSAPSRVRRAKEKSMQITGNDTETGAGPRGWFTGAVAGDAVAGRPADPRDADRRAAAVRLVRPSARRPRIVWPARGSALASRPTHTGSWGRPRAERPAARPR